MTRIHVAVYDAHGEARDLLAVFSAPTARATWREAVRLARWYFRMSRQAAAMVGDPNAHSHCPNRWGGSTFPFFISGRFFAIRVADHRAALAPPPRGIA